MTKKIKKHDEEDIKNEFLIITDEEYRDAVINHEFPEFYYGLVLPEIGIRVNNS